MAKTNWEQLKRQYILGKDKTLKEFAERVGLNYGYLRKKAIGWDKEKGTKREQKENKIIERTIEKVVEKESEKELDRNQRFLNVSDMALDAIEEYFSEKHHKKHVVKYRYMNKDGKLEREELTSVLLDVADTKAMSNMVGSLEKVQKGHRLALGLDSKDKPPGNPSVKPYVDALKGTVSEVWEDEK